MSEPARFGKGFIVEVAEFRNRVESRVTVTEAGGDALERGFK